MKYKILWLITLLALVGALAVIYFLIEGTTPELEKLATVAQNEEVNEVEPRSQYESGSGTIEELMNSGENLECNISHEGDRISNEKTEGILYVSRDRMRGDFKVPDREIATVSSMIITNDIMYSWSVIEGEKYGVKVDLNKLAKAKADAPESTLDANEPVPVDEKVSFDCKEWKNIDGTVFEPPSDVIFKDFADISNAGMEFGNIYEE